MILENNSSISKEEIDSIMSAETWLEPTEALSKGFADDIISTDRFSVNNDMSVVDIQNLANDLYSNNQIINKMKDLKNHLKLSENASETEVIASIKATENNLSEVTSKNELLKVENEALKTKFETIENESEAMKTSNESLVTKIATFQVENAIANGIFPTEKKESLIKQAKNDIDAFVSIIDSLNKRPAKITNVINSQEKPNKGLRDLEKSNPGEVQRLINQEPETYKAMFKEEYGVTPNL